MSDEETPSLPYAEQILPNWLIRRAATMPDRLALSAGDTHWTFADLDRAARQCAGALAARGVMAGDRVALLTRNRAEFAAMVHAMPLLETVLVPLNIRLTAPELAWQLADVGARLLIYDDDRASQAAAIQHYVPRLDIVTVENLTDTPTLDLPLRETIDLDALHTIIYTSGTTGHPKGAMLTYGNHWWSAVGSALHLGLYNNDCWLVTLPLFHINGLAILMRGAVYGASVILHAAFDAAAANRVIDESGASIVPLTSRMLQCMLDERGTQSYPATLRYILLGDPAPLTLLDVCERRGLPVVQTYGLTETASHVVALTPADMSRKPGSVGQPLLPLEVRILLDGQPAALGRVGEILLRGPTVMSGYVNRPDATAAVLRNGWLHTGDLGFLDDDGYLVVVDRRNNLIICGGEQIYPAEIEAVLLAHPAIVEAGVTGSSDTEWGPSPQAWIVPHPSVSLDETGIIAFCRERLAQHKVPQRINVVEALPRTAAGKLRRCVLRTMNAETPASEYG